MNQDPQEIKLYHITSYQNLESIVFQDKALVCKRELLQKQKTHVDIAYGTVQNRRFETLIPHPPYGNLHDYVPFSFCPRPVMLYPIKNGKVPQYQRGQEEIIHLITDFNVVCRLNLEWVFTDGHAIMGLTEFFNNPAGFDKIDWAIIQSRNWADTLEGNDRKRRKQAEFLVYGSFPWIGVQSIVTINKEIKAYVESILNNADHKPSVTVNPHFYY